MKTTLKLLAVLHIMIVYLLWASEWNGMKSKKEDPPRLIAVLSSQGALQNIYVVGAGQKLEPQTFLLQDRFLKLLCAYYAWDAIPQFFLSFRIYSAPCLGGQKTEFITSNNYLKFCKRFESM